jgi:hypothetical protein
MKIRILKHLTLAAVLGLVAGDFATVARAAASPVGIWDFVISGNRRCGTAYMEFEADGTIVGQELFAFLPKPKPKVDTDPRGGTVSGIDPRTGKPTGSTSLEVTNFFGGGGLSGLWGFDEYGRTVGFLERYHIEIDTVVTNVVTTNMGVAVTNQASVNVTNTITNSLSFTATVKPGTRMTMMQTDPEGRHTYSGVPFQTVSNLTGSYIGVGTYDGVQRVEFFDLVTDPFPPNTFDLTGAGAGYLYAGSAMLSRQKKLTLVHSQTSGPSPFLVTALGGSFNPATRRGTVSGTDGNGARITFRISPYSIAP